MVVILIPKWVCKVEEKLKKEVDKLAVGYGIPLELIDDSISIKNSINSIANTFWHIKDLLKSKGKSTVITGLDGVDFGEYEKEVDKSERERKNNEKSLRHVGRSK